MRFCCKVYNSIKLMQFKQFMNLVSIYNISFDKMIIWFALYITEIFKIPCISKLVEIENLIIGIFIYKESDQVRTYKSSSTSNKYFFMHILIFKSKLYLNLFH